MAAATRPPGLGDARVPCPQCGGLIHPVAGRCKHCKEDLSALRAGRPQAATPLPALNAVSQPATLRNGYEVAPDTNHVVAAAIPIAIPPAREGSQPILPQRPTSQWRMKAQKEPGRWLRNWPLIVIVLAVLAIVAAVVILVLPKDKKDGGKRQLMPAPAPDRMETNPMPPKASQIDPWGQPGDPYANPRAPDPAPINPPNDPLPDDPDDLDDPDDIYGGLGGGGTGGLGGGGMTGSFVIAMADKACKKATSCATTNQQVLNAMCGQFSAIPKPPVAASCTSGQRCLEAIEKLDCDALDDNPITAAWTLQDCVKAVSEC